MKGTNDEGRKVDEGVWGIGDIKELLDAEDKVTKPTQWGLVTTDTFKALGITRKLLPSGAYNITKDNNDGAPVFFRKDVKGDKTIRVSEGISPQIIKEIHDFWRKGDVFKKYGFLHSRGYLLYGNQGVGKSCIVQQVMSDAIADGGVVFICGNPAFFNLGLKVFRQTEPNRPLVCVFEDIDAIIRKYGDDELLSILDGANQVDRVLNIATTNFPENLNKRIISRPRRFDRVYKIEGPNENTRREYLASKLPKSEKLNLWVKKTTGISFAGLAETLISVLCLGNSLDETVRVLKDLENGHPNSQDFGNVGFGKGGGAGTTGDIEGNDRDDEATRRPTSAPRSKS